MGCSYIAFEPFIRRIWPQSLISWTRTLDGRFRDPLVGRHLLIGVLIGIGVTVLLHFGEMARPQGEIRYSPALLGVTDILSRMLAAQFEAIRGGIGSLILLIIFIAVARRQWIAGIGLAAFLLFVFYGVTDATPVAILFRTTQAAFVVTMLIRFGYLAFIVAIFTARMLSSPITTDSSAWYFGSSATVLLIVLAVAVFGFYTAIGARRFSRSS